MPTFYTHDNGTLAYKVDIYDKDAKVYKRVPSCNNEIKFCGIPTLHFQDIKEALCDERYAGERNYGSSVLLVADENKLYLVCDCIKLITLKPEENLKSFHGPVYSNDVPMPYIVTDKRTIMLAETPSVAIPNYLIDTEYDNPYEQMYKPRGGAFVKDGDVDTVVDWSLVNEMTAAYEPAHNFWRQPKFQLPLSEEIVLEGRTLVNVKLE